jgi:hypothetical protein
VKLTIEEKGPDMARHDRNVLSQVCELNKGTFKHVAGKTALNNKQGEIDECMTINLNRKHCWQSNEILLLCIFLSMYLCGK